MTSWYESSKNQQLNFPQLRGETTCDVCIIGGGFAGLSAALELSKQGRSVILLEAKTIGYGASGRNGGQIIRGFDRGFDEIAKHNGKENAQTILEMTNEAIDLLKDRVSEHQINCDLTWGFLLAAIKKRHIEDLKYTQNEWEKTGYKESYMLDTQAVRSQIKTDKYIAALCDPGSGHLHPLNYALGLAKACTDLGVQIFEHSKVTKIKNGLAKTEYGQIKATDIILAGNAYMHGLYKKTDNKTIVVNSYMIATEPMGKDRAKELIPENVAVVDCNFVPNYYRLSADHRLLFGGQVSYSGLDLIGQEFALQKQMTDTFPQLSDLKAEYRWGGKMAFTMNRLPHIGRLDKNIYAIHGFSGHGVATTGLAGKLIAEALTGTQDRFDVFAQINHLNFPGGQLLKRPAFVMAALWFRLRDLL